MTFGTALRRRLPWSLRRGGACTHLDQVRQVRPSTAGCEECLRTADTWVHLRTCLARGKVGCRDRALSQRPPAGAVP